MALLPIDVATMAPKSMEVSHIHQSEQIRQEMSETKSEMAYAELVKHNQEKTVDTVKSENKEYRYDAKDGKKQQQGQNRKKRQKKEDTDTSTQEDYKTGKAVFDVKI